MTLSEFIENLEIENTLIESGSNQILRHYTTLPGLIGILNKEKIQSYAYSDSKENEVSVIRPSGDIQNISNIAGDKNIIGYFEIEFHKLDDEVKRVRKEGEERIIGAIPLSDKYMKFHFIQDINTINMSNKAKSTLQYYMKMYPNLFN